MSFTYACGVILEMSLASTRKKLSLVTTAKALAAILNSVILEQES
jgi:hypothetical protein